jgi:hypothetical protein
MHKQHKLLLLSGKIIFALFVWAFFALPAWAVDLTLGWDPNSEKDLEGYAVYKRIGAAPTSKDLDGYVAVKDLANPAYPMYPVTGLVKGTKVHLALKAYNTAGVYSAFSEVICVQIGDTIGLCSDTPPPPPGGGDTGGGSGGGGGGGGGCFIGSAGLDISAGALAAALAALLITGLAGLGWAQKRKCDKSP